MSKNKRVDVAVPDLQPGQEVEVVIEVADVRRRRSILEILAECEGQRVFKSADEVDRYIREERDAWER